MGLLLNLWRKNHFPFHDSAPPRNVTFSLETRIVQGGPQDQKITCARENQNWNMMHVHFFPWNEGPMEHFWKFYTKSWRNFLESKNSLFSHRPSPAPKPNAFSVGVYRGIPRGYLGTPRNTQTPKGGKNQSFYYIDFFQKSALWRRLWAISSQICHRERIIFSFLFPTCQFRISTRPRPLRPERAAT